MTPPLLIPHPPLTEGDAPYTAKMCKVSDGGPQTHEPAEVTCERCLQALLDHEISLWRQQISAQVAEQLSDGIESEDGYDVWHARAGEVCLAIAPTKVSSLVKLAGELHRRVETQVDWYCKLTPVHEHYSNHGWQIKVCYRHESMGGYEHIDLWMPFGTDPHVLAQLVSMQRRAAERAIERGMGFGAMALAQLDAADAAA